MRAMHLPAHHPGPYPARMGAGGGIPPYLTLWAAHTAPQPLLTAVAPGQPSP